MRPAPKRGALATALWLIRSGLLPVPISARTDPRAGSPGKSPLGRGWGEAPATPERLRETFAKHPGAGVGLLLGPAGGAVDVEVDDPEGAAAVPALAELPDTLGWQSARGGHRVYAWDDRVGRLADKAVVYLAGGAVELRLGGPGKQLVSVCPPTVGTDGRRRLWNGVWRVAPFPEALLAEMARPTPATCWTPLPPPAGAAGAYAAAALGAEADRVRAAAEGTRNRTLNAAAFNLGQLVAAGLLGRGAVEAELAAAAAAAGLPGREVAATLRSGIEAGLRHPRATRPRR